MTSRDRVLTALAHDAAGSACRSSSAPATPPASRWARIAASKRGSASMRPIATSTTGPELGTATLDEEALRRLGSDARGILDRFPADVYRRNLARDPTPWLSTTGEPGRWRSAPAPGSPASTP
ncbi:MAG: hypothetical protein MZV65_01255 [Chromatiales bacterium]|nr:hypothetical protein [Chromatiales bacterium]